MGRNCVISELHNDQLSYLKTPGKQISKPVKQWQYPYTCIPEKIPRRKGKGRKPGLENFYSIFEKFKSYKSKLIGALTLKKYNTLQNQG
jgi:hypothetical protein